MIELRWFMFLHYVSRKRERFYLRLSRMLPKELRMWVYTCVFADVLTKAFPNKTPDEVSAMDVYGHAVNLDF